MLVSAKISGLQKRIDVLQSCLSGWTKGTSIAEFLKTSAYHYRFLSMKGIAAVKSRLDSVNEQLLFIQEEWQKNGETERQVAAIEHNSEGIDRIYNDFLSRGGDQPQAIPQNLARLESLATIHERSAEVFLKIEEMEAHQQAIFEALREDEEALGSVRESMRANLSVMRENLASLRARIDAAKK